MRSRVWTPFLLFLAACDRDQSVFAPRGPAAKRIAVLGGGVLFVFCVVAVVMFVLLLWISLRKRGSLAEHEPAGVTGGQSWILLGGFAIPTVILAVTFIVTLGTMSAFPLRHHSSETDNLAQHPADIVVIGHQWWWQADYVGENVCNPSSPDGHGTTVDGRFTTANELHIPVGQPVDIALHSADVIHSFWVPQLHGKVDLVPGQENRIRIVASQPGRYRGECAEYCGEQHAHMILYVNADMPEQYAKWVAGQKSDAALPVTPEQKRGHDFFERKACVLCHTIRGTDAHGLVGPDLTHLASRGAIATGSYPNDVAYLSAWVTHAQSLKSGAVMPDLTEFSGDDLHDLVAYLQHLQ